MICWLAPLSAAFSFNPVFFARPVPGVYPPSPVRCKFFLGVLSRALSLSCSGGISALFFFLFRRNPLPLASLGLASGNLCVGYLFPFCTVAFRCLFVKVQRLPPPSFEVISRRPRPLRPAVYSRSTLRFLPMLSPALPDALPSSVPVSHPHYYVGCLNVSPLPSFTPGAQVRL